MVYQCIISQQEFKLFMNEFLRVKSTSVNIIVNFIISVVPCREKQVGYEGRNGGQENIKKMNCNQLENPDKNYCRLGDCLWLRESWY